MLPESRDVLRSIERDLLIILKSDPLFPFELEKLTSAYSAILCAELYFDSSSLSPTGFSSPLGSD